jgi:hypothetical protein
MRVALATEESVISPRAQRTTTVLWRTGCEPCGRLDPNDEPEKVRNAETESGSDA